MIVGCLTASGKHFYAYSGQEQIQQYIKITQKWVRNGKTEAMIVTNTGKECEVCCVETKK